MVIQLKDWHDQLALVHSSLIVATCILLNPPLETSPSSSNVYVRFMCGFGAVLYVVDIFLMVFAHLHDSILVHHFVAIPIQFLFCWFNQGISYYQHFAWTELGTVLHKSCRFIPRTSPLRSYYQLAYLSAYLITYTHIVHYLTGLPADYEVKSVGSIPSSSIHTAGLLCLVVLLVYWSYQLLLAFHHVLSHMGALGEKKNM